MISEARRFIETVRHLKPEQIYGRALHMLSRPAPDLREAPLRREVTGTWVRPVAKPQSMLGASEFRFLNHPGSVERPVDWNAASQEKLWLYNLHYFDDLTAVKAENRLRWHRDLVSRWIADNPAAKGNGWEPYPTSLRITNWIKWALNGTKMEVSWLNSLAVQTRWLEKRLERHLLGNHLFANGKALVFAGAFFEGPEAEGWLSTGLEILRAELREQILSDGGHFELSPMYHSIILEDVLDLINLLRTYPDVADGAFRGQLSKAASGMSRWLQAMCHPDGQISFFNDAALGIAAAPKALEQYLQRCRLTPRDPFDRRVLHLEDSGYVKMVAPECVALLDCAAVGPDYLPGHAHADTLSFELSLFGQRVIVNGGTSVYGLSDERLRQRGTAAHSTVEIDGENSSEVWSGFRVARRAHPVGLSIDDEGEAATVSCGHDGYGRLRGQPIHRRTWHQEDRTFRISDVIEGSSGRAVSRFHFAPACSVSITPGSNGHLGSVSLRDGQTVSWHASAPARIVQSTWHLEFGVSIPSSSLEFVIPDREFSLELVW